jgi:hypothetical protein
MEKVSGLVLELAENECTVLAHGNNYLRLSMPDLIPAIGDIVEGYPVNTIHSLSNRRVSRIWAYVASILITVVLSGYQVYAVTSAPSAYVSLDMTQSVELVLNSLGKVIKTKSYNTEGSDLLKKVPIDTLPVDQALKALVKEAAHQSSPNNSNDVAILAFTDSSYLNRDDLNTLMLDTLEQEQFKGELIIDQVDPKFRNKAVLADVSLGQQLAMDLAAVDKINLSANELRRTPLSALLKEHNIKLKALIDSLKNYTNDFTGLSFSQISTTLESTSDVASLLPVLYQNREPVTNPSPATVVQVSAETNPVASNSSIRPTQNLTVSASNTNTSQTQTIVSDNKDPLVKQTSKQETPKAIQSNKNDKDTNLDKATVSNNPSDDTDFDSKEDPKKLKSENQEHSKKATKDNKEHKTVISL